MVTYVRPGTYASVSSVVQQVAPSNPGGITFAIGTAPFGTDQPGAVYYSLAQFQAQYGDAGTYPGYTGPLWAQLFFQQSGPGGLAQGMMFRRVGAAHAVLTLAGSTSTSLTLTAKPNYAGVAGNSIAVVVPAESSGNQIITFTDANGIEESYTVPDSPTPATSLLNLVNAQSNMLTASAPTDGGAFTTGTFNPAGGVTGLGVAITSTDINTAATWLPNFLTTLDGNLSNAELVMAAVLGSSANYSKPRVGVCGPSIGTIESTIETNLAALSTANGRMCYIGHDGLQIESPATGLQITVDGFYGSAILCGVKCASDPAEPATNKPVAGLLGVNTSLAPADENTLAGDGATIFTGGYKAGGGSAIVILDSVTTTTQATSLTWNKLVNVTAIDNVINQLTQFDQVYVIGKRGGSKTGQIITTGWSAILQNNVNQSQIDAYAPVVPTQTGTVFTVPLALTALNETDQVIIPISISS